MNEIRVLLVDGELSDADFIREALSEMQERARDGAWVQCQVTHLERAEDALVVMESEPPDIILFNPTLPDKRGLDTFSTFHNSVPEIPLIALLNSGEEGIGRRMLRQGAQDFVVKREIDCQPLARAILNAIERQRFRRAMQRVSVVDLETGFYNSDGFRAMAGRDLQLARERDVPVTLVLAELDNLLEVDAACGRSATHEMVIDAADVVRRAAGGTALVGRDQLGRFVMLDWHSSSDRLVTRLQNAVQAELHPFAFTFGHASVHGNAAAAVDELIRTAEAVLDENKLVSANLL